MKSLECEPRNALALTFVRKPLKEEMADADAPSGSLPRGIAVLTALAGAAQPLTLAELAAATGIDQSTTLRLLRVLEDIDYVIRVPESKRYLPSPKVLMPLPLMHPLEQLRMESWPVLHELASELRQTVVLMVYLGMERMVLNLVRGPEGVAPYYGSWMHGPLHATAIGKSLLLTYDAAQRKALLGPEPFASPTKSTLTLLSDVEADLALSVERGYTVAKNEYYEGLSAVAANIATWEQIVVGCVAVTAQTASLEGPRMNEIGSAVKHAARQLLFRAPSLAAAARYCRP